MKIRVSEHAMWRAAERFRGFDTVTIEDEVREALRAGRISAHKPEGLDRGPHPFGLYVWTEDGERVYGVIASTHPGDEENLVVATTLRKGWKYRG